MTNCWQCNDPIDTGQCYVEVRQMTEQPAGNPVWGFAHWPHCPTTLVERGGVMFARMNGHDYAIGPAEKYQEQPGFCLPYGDVSGDPYAIPPNRIGDVSGA